MIARAIAPKPKILMFDEATSALDNKPQNQVCEALDKMGCIFLWCVLLFTFIQLVIVVRRNMLGISRKTDNICRLFVTVFI